MLLVQANVKLTNSVGKLTEKLAQASQTVATLMDSNNLSLAKTKSTTQQLFSKLFAEVSINQDESTVLSK